MEITPPTELPNSHPTIDAVIRGEVARLLRQHGFKRTGRTFRKRQSELWLIVNFQGSLGNTWAKARFYVNLSVYNPALAAAKGLSTSDSPHEFEGQQRRRLEPQEAGWWELTAETDLTACAAGIATLLRQEGLPWLEQAAFEQHNQNF